MFSPTALYIKATQIFVYIWLDSNGVPPLDELRNANSFSGTDSPKFKLKTLSISSLLFNLCFIFLPVPSLCTLRKIKYEILMFYFENVFPEVRHY